RPAAATRPDSHGRSRPHLHSISGRAANAIFEWIECWYNPIRRHSSIGMLSPADYETAHTPPHQDH
ncbi:hypothetical protein FVA95_27320, partial [Pseudonocardia sp. EV170527-09]